MIINKKILFKVLVLLFFTIIADILIGHILQSLYFKAKFNVNYHINYVVNEASNDVLIFGGSRAAHHYIPSILSDSLLLSVYNCGLDGQCIYYHYGLLMKISERYLPKVVILDISFSDFHTSHLFTIEGVKYLFPYYGSNKDLDLLIHKINPFEKFKMASNLYRYNSRLVDIFRDNFRKADQNWENGYVPLFGQTRQVKNVKRNQREEVIEKEKITYLEKFILFCIHNNIKLFLCMSPIDDICENYNNFIPIENIAMKYNVPVFNHFCDTFFVDNNLLFKDVTHLNNDGAIVYSKIIGTEIKNNLKDIF